MDKENAKTKDVELTSKIQSIKDKISEDSANKRKVATDKAYEEDKKRLSDEVINQQIKVNEKIKGTQEWADESKKLVDKTYAYDLFVAKKDATQINLAKEAQKNAIKAIEDEQFNYMKEGYQKEIDAQESKVADLLVSQRTEQSVVWELVVRCQPNGSFEVAIEREENR